MIERFIRHLSKRSSAAAGLAIPGRDWSALPVTTALLLLVGCSKPTAAPTGSLTVRVYDVMSQLLSGINVAVNPEGRMKTTDEYGRAVFADLPVGEYRIRVSNAAYETSLDTVVVEEGQMTDLEITLTGKPAVLDVQVLLYNAPKSGVTVRVKRKLDGAVMCSGTSGQDGKVLFEGIAAQPVTVVTDTLGNMCSHPADVELVSLQTSQKTINLCYWSSLFKGNFSFGNYDPHQAGVLEWTGTELLEALAPTYFTGTYRLITTETGDLLAIQLGNPGPFEMAVVFSPIYNASSYWTFDVPTQNSVITSASPRDYAPYYTNQIPITLTCYYPMTNCVYNEWEVDYWRFEGGVWYWTMVEIFEPYSPDFQWKWRGTINSTSTLYGQALPANADGEYYSWYVAAGYTNNMLCLSPDYFILLKTPPAAGALTIAGSRIGTAERAALMRRMAETRLERAALVLERTGRHFSP